jgi:uncharacterized protein YPO0396
MIRRLGVLSLVALFLGLSSSVAYAQQYRYMDEAGTIHFVDSLAQVPARYKEQVAPSTPTPILDKKALMAKKREEQRLAREKMQEERRRKNEERRLAIEKRKAAEREKKRLEREQQQSSFSRPK